MKKIILSSALIVATMFASQMNAQVPASGQGKHHKGQHQNLSPDERVKKETETAVSKLGLNSDQKLKWEQASRERIAAIEPLKERMQGSTTPKEREELKSQMQLNKKKFDENVLSFLNAEQKTKYEAFKKERKDKRKGHQKKGMN